MFPHLSASTTPPLAHCTSVFPCVIRASTCRATNSNHRSGRRSLQACRGAKCAPRSGSFAPGARRGFFRVHQAFLHAPTNAGCLRTRRQSTRVKTRHMHARLFNLQLRNNHGPSSTWLTHRTSVRIDSVRAHTGRTLWQWGGLCVIKSRHNHVTSSLRHVNSF
jgi:hypothetical protein